MKEETYFTQQDFLEVLIPLLMEKNIRKIEEENLEKKLYDYRLNPRIRTLFENFRFEDKKVILTEGIEQEVCDQRLKRENDLLVFQYPSEVDYKKIKKYYGEFGVRSIHELSEDLSKCINLEINYPYLRIHRNKPDGQFVIVDGMSEKLHQGWNILTDGKIGIVKDVSLAYRSVAYDNPQKENDWIRLYEAKAILYSVKEASFVTRQGYVNDETKRVEIYTNVENKDALQEIVQESFQIHAKEKPYIKKIERKIR